MNKSDSLSSLQSHHLEDLKRSGLSVEAIARAGFFSASADSVKSLLGFNPNDSPGLAIPYPSLEGDKRAHYVRVKIDSPPLLNGKPAKYLSPKGSQNHLYIPLGVWKRLKDISIPLYITEGEKKALKAVQEGLDCIALAGVWCWKGKCANGESRPIRDLDLIQWKGRLVYIIFDSDADQNPSVRRAEKALAEELSSRGAIARAIRLPGGEEDKTGLDDFLVAHSVKELLQLPQHDPLVSRSKGESRRESQSGRLLKMASDLYLFHDQNREAFAFIDCEAIPLKSKRIKQWLTRRLFHSEGKTPNSDSLNQAIMALEAKAIYDGSRHTLSNRIAKKDDAFWYDMGNGKAVRINPDGWEIVNAPVLFRRYSHQQEQVAPLKGGDPHRILEFLNVKEDNKLLVLICVISYFVPDIAHPIFHPHGPHGAGKTCLFKVIKRLCDPSSVEALITPRDLSQLIQIISHHHVCLFDNLSSIPTWMSDVLSQACTGGGFSKRQLYTDDDDIIYQVKRCIGINGINLLIKKPDLMDRSVLVYLDRIEPSQRVEEARIWNKYQDTLPEVLGGIFDTLARAMSIYPDVEFTFLPRMADFAKWGYAIAEALGYGGGEFLNSYQRNIEKQNDEVIQSNTLAQSVLIFMKDKEEWSGTVREAWTELFDIAQPTKADPSFPKSERTLRKYLENIKANLLDYGISYEIGPRGERGYPISFQKNKNFDSANTASASLVPEKNTKAEPIPTLVKQAEFDLMVDPSSDPLKNKSFEQPELNELNYPKSWDEI